MKIIDLLNKIANGEEVPEYIAYYNKKESMSMIMLPCKGNIIYRLNEDAIDLNDEVEIPEEIPEKEDELIRYNIHDFDNLKAFVEITTNDVFGKINKIINKQNKIIDYLEYLKSKGDE